MVVFEGGDTWREIASSNQVRMCLVQRLAELDLGGRDEGSARYREGPAAEGGHWS